MRLGKLAPRVGLKPLHLFEYTLALPEAPEAVDWSKGVTQWGMLANDRLGDCTAAGVAHAVQTWTGNNGGVASISDQDVIEFYAETAGYDPADPDSDQGAVEADVLTYWHKHGFGTHQLAAFAAVRTNADDVRDSIWLLGGCYLGLELPISAQNQDVWDIVGGPGKARGSWGGHCVYAVAYDASGVCVVTWGQLKRMSWNFFTAYCSEAWALLSREWISKEGRAPSGFDWPALVADMREFLKANGEDNMADVDNSAAPELVPAGFGPVPGKRYDYGVTVNTTDANLQSFGMIAGAILAALALMKIIPADAVASGTDYAQALIAAVAAFGSWWQKNRAISSTNINTLVKLGLPLPERRGFFGRLNPWA